MARGKRLTFEEIMKTPTKNFSNKKSARQAALILTKIGNKRIEQVERAGYSIIKNQSKFFINPRTGRFAQVRENDSTEYYQRRINQLKAFMNSPGNDIKKIKKEKQRLKEKFKEESISESDYAMYRKQAGRLWAQMDEREKTEGIGSDRMETIIITNMKTYRSFNQQLKHINESIAAENEADKIKKKLFEAEMAKLNS